MEGYSKYIPYGTKSPTDMVTKADHITQLWQEITMLRHFSRFPTSNIGKKISPYLDQAKVYFLDSTNCNWRTSGLLYYYSFLNLAKAQLISKNITTDEYMSSNSIYHGLDAQPQVLTHFTDYQFNIHPPNSKKGGKWNIFTQFYQSLTGEKWPFTKNISVAISDFLPYCFDISHELKTFYNIKNNVSETYSLLRYGQNEMFLELCIETKKLSLFENELSTSIKSVVRYNGMTEQDKKNWLEAHNISATQLQSMCFLRFKSFKKNDIDFTEQYHLLNREVIEIFDGFILPVPNHNMNVFQFWYFIPKLSLNDVTVKWHPLLSDYLFSFMLSSILRYQPHLFKPDTRESFIAEAWINQSPSTALRYFLLELSPQNLRLN